MTDVYSRLFGLLKGILIVSLIIFAIPAGVNYVATAMAQVEGDLVTSSFFVISSMAMGFILMPVLSMMGRVFVIKPLVRMWHHFKPRITQKTLSEFEGDALKPDDAKSHKQSWEDRYLRMLPALCAFSSFSVGAISALMAHGFIQRLFFADASREFAIWSVLLSTVVGVGIFCFAYFWATDLLHKKIDQIVEWSRSGVGAR